MTPEEAAERDARVARATIELAQEIERIGTKFSLTLGETLTAALAGARTLGMVLVSFERMVLEPEEKKIALPPSAR